MSKKGQWNSTLTFIFAMIGLVVGLGNIWRFSYVVYTNGGGTFFIPYIIAISIMGIPFLILEYGLGSSFKKPFTDIMKSIRPKFEIIGWILILLTFIVAIYYVVILSWDLVYLGSSFTFNWGTDAALYFTNSVGGSANLSNANFLLIPTTVGVLILWIIWFICNKDVDEGIGKASKILIPLLALIMGIIVIYGITLLGASIGINALFTPDWSKLFDVNIWLAAFGQAVFSLSVGQALAVTYASYLPENTKLTDSVFLVVISNSAFEVFNAIGVFSILGFMSHTAGTPINQLVTEGTGLIFVVFPMIFNIMGSMGRILAPMLFVAILFAGITSAFGLFEPMLNSIYNKLGWSRRKTATLLCIIGCAFSLTLTTGISSYIVGVIDGFVNQFGVLLLILIQAIIFGWIYNLDDLIPILNEYSKIKVGRIWKIIIRYVLPILLLIIWGTGIIKLFSQSNNLEIIVYLIISIVVLALSYLFTKKKSVTE